jgi:hypothetical protein
VDSNLSISLSLRMEAAASDTRCEPLELFWGRTSPAAATFYVRWTGEEPAGVRIAGRIEGPDCRHAATLRAEFPLTDLGADPQPLARATITEPCFWTPRTPYVYRARLEVWQGNRPIGHVERLCGAGPLGADGRSLRLAGKRWVLRGVWRDSVPLEDVSAWIAAAAVACLPAPSDALCREASLRGLAIAARVEGCAEAVAGELRRLARWPAVVMAVLPGDTLAVALKSPPPGLLLAQRVGRDESWAPHSWAHVLFAEVHEPIEFARRAVDVARPVVAFQRSAESEAIGAARADCDRLQRDLAPWGDFAGYVV